MQAGRHTVRGVAGYPGNRIGTGCRLIRDWNRTVCAGETLLAPWPVQPGDLSGEIHIGGQDHFYLEGHIALVVPQEDDDLLVHTSCQHPSEVQEAVGHALSRPSNAITVEVRRMGGAFGGKETQAAQWAVIAALLADKTSRLGKASPGPR